MLAFMRFIPILVFITLIIELQIGCSGPDPKPIATIKYHQVGGCNGYLQGNDAVSVGPHAAYVVFNIESIDNTQPSSDFNFDPSRLFINEGSREFVDPRLRFARDLSVFGTVPVTVPHGQIRTLNGFSIVVVSTTSENGSIEANRTNYFLLYNTQSTDPGILLNKTNSSQTSWPQTDDCRLIQLQ